MACWLLMIQWWIWAPFPPFLSHWYALIKQSKTKADGTQICSSANNTSRSSYDYCWMETAKRKVSKLLSVRIKLVYYVSIWCCRRCCWVFFFLRLLLLHYDYAACWIFSRFAVRRLETARNSTESMNLNITVFGVKAASEMARNPLSWKRVAAFLLMPAAFPVMDTVSEEVTRLSAVSHCIDSYLKVSRPIIIYWCLLQSTFCL